ncbi:MAG: heme-binding domain-containing protein [Flavobacteriales bacterium]
MINIFLKIALGLILTGIIIQFYPIDRSVKKLPKSYDILRQEKAPQKIAYSIKKACYDCHSNETQYPNYALYAPLSWYIEFHIEEGRKNANFSKWKKYDQDQKNSIIKNSIETLENQSMPLKSYLYKHPEAHLLPEDRETLIAWFKSLYTQ